MNITRPMPAAAAAALLGLAAVHADAVTTAFSFSGPGVSGTVLLTYGSAADAKYPQAFEVTGVSGTFSDTNNGLNIVGASIGSLVAINHATPEPTNLLAPADFSKFAVAAGLPPENNGSLSYDNLYYPGGSPQTASDYPFSGGVFDIYGMMFDIGNGRVVNLWSNGILGGDDTGGPVNYGVAVATASQALDYVGDVAAVPEPSTFALLMAGLGVLGWAARRSRSRPAG